MNLHAISIVPVEFFSTSAVRKCIGRIKANGMCTRVDGDTLLSRFITELGGSDYEVYELPSEKSAPCTRIVVRNTSLCFVVERVRKDFDLSQDGVREELFMRNRWHESIIQGRPDSCVAGVLDLMLEALGKHDFSLPRIHYAFSYYIIECESALSSLDERVLKMLSAPSLMDIDDMLSTACVAARPPSVDDLKEEFLGEVRDCDMSNTARTYITWATIVSATTQQELERTKALITALECKLQLVWNRCYATSVFIDSVFDSNSTVRSVSALYWDFVRNLDNAKSIASPTSSTRANRLFSEMMKTSFIHDEIQKMSHKIDHLERYVSEKNMRKSRVYQKSVEILLFITALSALIQVLFPIPIELVDVSLRYAIVSAVALIGVISIAKSG
uniref:hypothetical protein n=1 Tax=Castellaniella defragrans TaxID=75697 RepID=UPI0033410450